MSPAEATREWVQNFVIRHNLCPFAAKPMLQNSVRFVSCDTTDFDEMIRHFLSEALLMTEQPATALMTTLIVYPQGLEQFEDFLDYEVAVEAVNEEAGLGSFIQFAHFHPGYIFASVPIDDPANATNRSPFPTLQLLRVAEMSQAIDNYPNVEDIPQRNIALLRSLAKDQ